MEYESPNAVNAVDLSPINAFDDDFSNPSDDDEMISPITVQNIIERCDEQTEGDANAQNDLFDVSKLMYLFSLDLNGCNLKCFSLE